jgi:transcriptional regulator with PAS, ATPase and Fis domain
MYNNNWIKEFPGAVIVCDTIGIVLEMNDRAAKTFQEDGGYDLIGKSLIDCHPEPSRTKLKELLDSQRINVYTIEKNGIKKLIYQVPWYKDGKYSGLVEMSLEIPFDMPHFVRDK